MAKIKTTKWDVLDYLGSEEGIIGYLEAALEENDPAFFIKALGDAAKARGINEMAKKMKVGRESLYKSFAENKKPYFETVFKAIDAFGLKLMLVPKEQEKETKQIAVD